MVTQVPDHCPSCGAELTSLEPANAYYCASCDEYVFHEPSPVARVAVLDGDSLLLVEIADEARIEEPPYDVDSEWMTPGGHPELGEQPAVAAARELEEETGLVVDPDALELFEVVTRQVVEDVYGLAVLYAVDRAATTGTLAAATDAADARFWTPAGLASADATFREFHAEPAECRTLDWWIRRARAAVGEGTR